MSSCFDLDNCKEITKVDMCKNEIIKVISSSFYEWKNGNFNGKLSCGYVLL